MALVKKRNYKIRHTYIPTSTFTDKENLVKNTDFPKGDEVNTARTAFRNRFHFFKMKIFRIWIVVGLL